MADIGEAYFHLSPFEVNNDSLSKLGEQLSQIARERAERAFQFETTLKITLAPGSLKGWVAAGAALYGIYQGVAQYSDFKKSINELSTDVRFFTQAINETFFRTVNVVPSQVYRTERRTKSIGRISRLLNRIESLERSCNFAGRSPTSTEVRIIEELIRLAIEDLSPKEIALVNDQIQSPGSPLAPKMPLSKYIIIPRTPRIEKSVRFNQVLVPPGPPTYEIRGSTPSLSTAVSYKVPTSYWESGSIAHGDKPIKIYRNTLQTTGSRRTSGKS